MSAKASDRESLMVGLPDVGEEEQEEVSLLEDLRLICDDRRAVVSSSCRVKRVANA